MSSLFPQGTADFSSDELYRWWLTREGLTGLPAHARTGALDQRTVAFCMLNPSVATADKDDPTIRRCKKFASAWGYHRVVIVNLYGYRATAPSEMWKRRRAGVDIVGEDNNSAIVRAVRVTRRSDERRMQEIATEHGFPGAGLASPGIVICAWGGGPTAKADAAFHALRVAFVARLIGGAAHCLKCNDDGSPTHPLYLPEYLEPQRWAA